MTPPDQILARLQATCPNLDWTYWYVTALDVAEYNGHIRNGDLLPPVLLNLRQYGDRYQQTDKAHIKMLELMHTFADIEAAIEWLEWLQGAIGK